MGVVVCQHLPPTSEDGFPKSTGTRCSCSARENSSGAGKKLTTVSGLFWYFIQTFIVAVQLWLGACHLSSMHEQAAFRLHLAATIVCMILIPAQICFLCAMCAELGECRCAVKKDLYQFLLVCQSLTTSPMVVASYHVSTVQVYDTKVLKVHYQVEKKH